MKSRLLPLCMAALLTGAGGLAVADDGAITNKSMSQNIQLPVFDQDIVNSALPEAEHAFTDMMGFYVPMQAASGTTIFPYDNGSGVPQDPTQYYNVDDELVEEIEVAKPLVNVFIYGPIFGVENTAFGHSFFDAYGAVSLDDGETWKKTNKDPLPNDHNILLGECEDEDEDEDEDECALHAKGYDTPYTAECTECHGYALQGTLQTPSCYSCHEKEWSEETPIDLGPIITQAEYESERRGGKLDIEGVNAASRVTVSILNAISGEIIGEDRASRRGEFEFEEEYRGSELPPCVVMAEYTDSTGKLIKGPAVYVRDEETGLPIEECEGSPLDLTEYPGGVFNVFHATAGNKTLVAWPSRFCQQGQPAYSMTTETGIADPDQQARLQAITDFIREGNTDLGVEGLPDFTSPIDGDANNDLYLTDAFGVQGRQGSIDFGTEGYPQAGVVPFGCVWTARGVLLPGDDPRTEDVEEASHMVWTKAERLTSGRRDPNRIEVMAVKDAGFVITWQEDPDGLRPGQGEGPGEGWSGAVAHPQTDIWYSFINWEYFDLVETEDNTLVPENIIDHDLTVSGRPQVFVPMAIPMRLTNNAKCQPPGVVTPGGAEPPIYCNFELAEIFGLDDQCADTVTIDTGSPENPQQTTICVADTMGDDGVADLPNRANTASTRPRLGLNGWGDETDKSAWVVVAAEESKGLGKYFFEPDGLLTGDFDGYADPCEEGSSITCTEEIGKNQWYFSYDMGTPDTSAGIGEPNSLVENLVNQGDLLNQPEVYWETGEFYGKLDTQEIGEYLGNPDGLYGDYDFEIVSTEIARRSSLLVQSIEKACDSENHLIALSTWKQGPMRQGGPADAMGRRFVAVCEDRCDNTNPGPGPGGAQPSITEAVYLNTSNCETIDGVEYCELVVEGFVCVDGAQDPTQIVISIEDAATGDDVCVAKVDDSYDFTTQFELPSGLTEACMVPVDEVPCDVIAVVGPGNTGGNGQASEPAEVVNEDGEPVCVDTPCSIDENVDAEQPVVESATLRRISTGGLRLQVTVSGYDGIQWDPATRTGTRLQLRNAVNTDLYGYPRDVNESGTSVTYNINADTWSEIPCAIQAADWDVPAPAFGPWTAVDTSGVPDVQCTGDIPPACTD